MNSAVKFIAEPAGQLIGDIRVPGDKSISHRSIMLGALADGTTRVHGFLHGDDCLATLNAFRAMGVKIDGPVNDEIIIHGVGIDGLKAPHHDLDMGNSGTSIRLMTGLMAGQSFDTVMVGDSSLMSRPMRRVTEPVTCMGASVSTAEAGTAPVRITGGARLRGIDYKLPVASAQVKSCVLLAGLYAEGQTIVTELVPTRDHTERMLRCFGYEVHNPQSGVCSLTGGGRLSAAEVDVPADISSAAFFMVGGSIAKSADINLRHVGINPTRTGIIDILRLMGADISINNQRIVGGEPVADIRVRSAPLAGIRIPEELVPRAIDEFPAIFIAASCAEGETVLTGAEELRVKESDRIRVMADGLKVLGVDAVPTRSGIVIQGGNGFTGGTVDSCDDHRIAMSFVMASLCADDDIIINDCANVDTSFPNFVSLAGQTGLVVDVDSQSRQQHLSMGP